MERNQRIAAAKEVLKANSSLKEVFVTQDGQCFTTEDRAYNHEFEVSGSKSVTDENKPILVTADEVATADKPIEKMNKTELQAKATELGLEFEDNATNKQLIEIINAKLTPAVEE
jgi:hypothetical protein